MPFVKKEIPLPVYKPVQIWRAESVEQAVGMCTDHSAEDSWVYLEIETERGYIRQDEIRMMKSLKEDLLEIRPIPVGKAGEKQPADARKEKDLKELFTEYYRGKNGGAEPDEELIELLLELSQKKEGGKT